jgi:Skp family chaperone for outer membrane proteins
MNKSAALFALTASLVLATPVMAADAGGKIRVATVDVNRVLNSSKEVESKKAELDALQKKMEAQIAAKRAALKTLEAKAKEKETTENVEALRRETRAFERLVNDNKEDFKRRFLAVNHEMTDKALQLITKYAQKHSIDLVLERSAGAQSPVLFGSPDVDITDAVIKAAP